MMMMYMVDDDYDDNIWFFIESKFFKVFYTEQNRRFDREFLNLDSIIFDIIIIIFY